ncbi:MAG: response regulator [Pseudobacter sp.]|uniref:response regulator n=1 Tax=Pseudobacter sp. TaxID=2045420 RepID=UPI003F7D7BEA
MENQQHRPIWIVDDDTDDHELIREIFREMKYEHPLQLFSTAEEMLHFLQESGSAPFIIISDLHLPKMNGLELREGMLRTPNNKFHSVPFIFWSTIASDAQVKEAFNLRAHGFFVKERTFLQWKNTLVKIIDYWTSSLLPPKDDRFEEAML